MVTRISTGSFLRPFSREIEQLDIASGAKTVGDLMPEHLAGDENVIAFRNGLPSGLDERVFASDIVSYASRPQGAAILPILIPLLVSAAVGFAMTKLFPPARIGERDRDDDESPTYSFQGISNNRVEGLPIPVIYGEMRVGGTIIQEYTEITNLFPISTDLLTLVCFGEGPIHSVGGVGRDTPQGSPLGSEGGGDLPLGIKINENSADNFDGVTAHVRLGTSEQSVIPGFEESRVAFEVDQKLTATESSSEPTNVYVIQRGNGAEFDGTNDAYWDEHAVAFDFNIEDIDEFVIRVEFRSGYYRIASDGNLSTAYFGMQVRYRELDGGGVPITVGGPNGDGWVRLPIIDNMPWSKRSSFNWEWRHPFLDKDGYVDPELGECSTLDGIDDRLGAAQDQYPVPPNVELQEFTISTWVFFDSGALAGASPGDFLHIIGDYDDATKLGWSLGLLRKTFSNFGDPFDEWSFAFEWGNGSQRYTRSVGGNTTAIAVPDEGSWYHLWFTYKNVVGDDTRWRLMVNSDILIDIEIPSSADLRATDQDLVIAHNPNGINSGRFEDIRIDDIHLYSIRLSNGVASQLWAGGNGTSVIIRADVCVANYTHDSGAFGRTNNAAPLVGGKWYGDLAVANGGPLTGLTLGKVSGQGSGRLKPAQYRVEAIRVNRESTNTNVVNEAFLGIITSIIDATLTYPFCPLLGLRIPATDQLNSTAPKITALVKGRLVPIWDGVDTVDPAISVEWSDNPAWIAFDILTHKRYGFGQFYEYTDITLPDLLAWANYCGESVYDGSAQIPFTVNGYDNVVFDNSTVDPGTGIVRGSLTFSIAPTSNIFGLLPDDWKIGKRIWLDGFPDASHIAIDNDINSASGPPSPFAGYVIFSIAQAPQVPSGAYIIGVYWDRLDEADPWTSGATFLSEVAPDIFSDFSATISGAQPRFAFNGVFDSSRSAWDALLEVCTVGRAIPVREGSKIRFKFNSPRSAVGVIGLGSILEDTFEINYRGSDHRPNLIEMLILDKNREYEQTPVDARSDSLLPADAASIRKQTINLFGVTSRQEANRYGRFIINTNERLLRGGTFTLGANGLEYEPGDVVRLAHDILPRGVSGRVWEDAPGPPWDRFKIDRDLTIAPATTYKVYLHDAIDRITEAEVDVAVTVPGDYSPGDEIRLTLSGTSNFQPRQDDVFIIVAVGAELLVEITASTLLQDMSKQVEFIEYDPTVYLDESFSIDANLDDYDDDDPMTRGFGDSRVNSDTLPSGVRNLEVGDRFVRRGNHDYVLTVSAAWQTDRHDVPYMLRHDVYFRLRSVDESDSAIGNAAASTELTPVRGRVSSGWRLVATCSATDDFVDFTIPGAPIGEEYEVAVCPVKRGEIKRRVDRCRRVIGVIAGFGPRPAAPTILNRNLRSERVVYDWDMTVGEEDSRMEIRRSSAAVLVKMGYILAPVVFEGTPGQLATEPMRDWAGSTVLGVSKLLTRFVNPLGHKSDLFLRAFNPDPKLDSWSPALPQPDQEWSTFTGGTTWSVGVPVLGSPVLFQLDEIGTTPDNYLELSGSNLNGNYRATFGGDVQSDANIDNFRQPREYMVEFIVVAEQIHPVEIGDFDDSELGFGWERWTFEGPAYLAKGESECTLVVQARFNVTGLSADWSSWGLIRPGVYTFAAIEWRVQLTRPTTAFQVKLHKFETRITALRRGHESRPPLFALLSTEFYE